MQCNTFKSNLQLGGFFRHFTETHLRSMLLRYECDSLSSSSLKPDPKSHKVGQDNFDGASTIPQERGTSIASWLAQEIARRRSLQAPKAIEEIAYRKMGQAPFGGRPDSAQPGISEPIASFICLS